MAGKVALVDPVLGPLTDDWLTRDVRVYQRQKGHRFSSDDVATAYVAFHAQPAPRRVLDMGCGLGSVLLLLAWKLPEAELAAVEAQQISFELLRRNVARSGFAERLHIAHGDLRDRALMATLSGPFELITGTPPYFAPSDALPAEDEQREYARIEHRGGVEAYIAAGAELLEPHGALVLCADARSLHRTTSACDEAGLHLRARTDIVARQGKPALFSVFTLRRDAGDCAESTLTLRGAAGEPTSDAAALREFSGMERK